MAVKIKDIAERANVSMPTVSHILGSRAHKYPAATQARVIAAAQELGYRPHGSARAMRTGRFGSVALLLSTNIHRSSLFTQFLDGVGDALVEHNLHLTLAKLPDAALTSETFVPKFLREWTVDGLLINYTHDIPLRFLDLIDKSGLPSVWINTKRDTDAVYPDDFAAGRQAAERLIGLGHRRISYADYPLSHHYSNADRLAGYTAAMQAAGLTPVRLGPESPSPAPAPAPSRDWGTECSDTLAWAARCASHLASPERPTAVLGYGDTAAEAVLCQALALGLRVPEDLSVMAFGQDIPMHTGWPVDTWLLPEYQMGRAAVEMLVSKVEAPQRALPPRVLPFQSWHGVTCADCPHTVRPATAPPREEVSRSP